MPPTESTTRSRTSSRTSSSATTTRAKRGRPAPAAAAGRTTAADKKASGGGANAAVRPTSLKLPAGLKAQIDDVAGRAGVSAHAFMLQTLTAATQRAYLREKFQQDSEDALQNMQSTGMGHELAAVRDYFSKLAVFRQGKGPRPQRPAMTKVF